MSHPQAATATTTGSSLESSSRNAGLDALLAFARAMVVVSHLQLDTHLDFGALNPFVAGGHVGIYLEAVETAFGRDVDYAREVLRRRPNRARKFSPPVVLAEEVRVINGMRDPSRISTSGVERQNLTMRMSMRRFTRLTNGFSKKAEKHAAAVALHYMYVNVARPHKSLANPYPRTPAMAAGVADHIWTCEEIAARLD